MKRTNSADYSENVADRYEGYYMRPGAMSATQIYNEDYNYAYQSTDNLPVQPEEVLSVVDPSVVNSSNMNTNNLVNNYETYSNDEYFYNNQEDQIYQDSNFLNDKSKRRWPGRGKTNSPLLQQNTDSLESRDDELKDSFDTAVSSVSLYFDLVYFYFYNNLKIYFFYIERVSSYAIFSQFSSFSVYVHFHSPLFAANLLAFVG